MEIVDGEIEVLAAGEWRAYHSGTQEYKASAGAATNLPAGKFLLTIRDRQLRLEWLGTQGNRRAMTVMREVRVK
jgi:hypothetical protein